MLQQKYLNFANIYLKTTEPIQMNFRTEIAKAWDWTIKIWI